MDKNEYFILRAHSYRHDNVQAPESEIKKVIKKVLQEESFRLKNCQNGYNIVIKWKEKK
jgi:hypothetical protein